MAGLSPHKYIDPTPYTFIITGLVIGFGLLRLQLFDVVPIAREKVIEAMQEGLLVLDKQNRIIDVNPEMEKILNTASQGMIGGSITTLFGHIPELINATLKNENITLEINLVVGDKAKVFNLTSTALSDIKHGYTGKILLFTDITELYAKEAIRQMMLKKDEFMSIASHELKTPITSMKGYLQIIDKISQKEENPAYKHFVSKANKQVDKVVRLISDLLDISRIQAGKMEYNFTEFEIGEVVQESITFSEYNSPTHKIEIKGDLSLRVKADKNRIEQVICNLLSNAVKYAPNTDKIILEISKIENRLKLSVTDFGFGIPKDKQENLFKKFSRIENSDYHISGLGIGLFLSQEIANRHGGNIELESEEGKGSTFYFTLALAG